jgi:hypothetical protein
LAGISAELQPEGTVFISYCHKDRRWLQRLLVHLKPLERQGVLDIWEDSRIEPGMPCEKKLERLWMPPIWRFY